MQMIIWKVSYLYIVAREYKNTWQETEQLFASRESAEAFAATVKNPVVRSVAVGEYS